MSNLIVLYHIISPLVPPLPLQQILDILLPLALLPRAPLGRKARGDSHLGGALFPQLVEAALLLQVGDAPLLEILDPGDGAVALKLLALRWAGLGRGAGILGGVDDVVGVEAAEVGVAGRPAEGALGAVGDGGAGADGVAAGVGGEWPDHCEDVVVLEEECVAWW